MNTKKLWMQWLTGHSSSWMHQQLPTSQCSEAGPEGQRASTILCACVPGCASRPCYAWMTLSHEQSCWGQWPSTSKKAWRRTPSWGPHLCPRTSINVWTCTKLMNWECLLKKNRCQWITQWLALRKPRHLLKISGENGRRDNIAIPTLPPRFQAVSLLSCGTLEDSLVNPFHVRSLSKVHGDAERIARADQYQYKE